MGLHRDAQRLLEPLAVVNPFADRLTFADDRTRTRRDYGKYLGLIAAVTLLHQHQRQRKTATVNGRVVPYVESTIGDIEIAHRLAHAVLGQSLDELPPQTRRLLNAVHRFATGEAKRHAIPVDLVRFDPDHAFAAEGAGARATLVAVELWGEPTWTVAFAAPDPGRRALTALLGTPRPTGLCVVERGTVFLGDVREPEAFEVVATPGPVVAAEELVVEGALLLVTPWAVTVVDARGVRWTTPRIAVDGLRIDEAKGGWIRGVADPDDDEPRDFAVDLATGEVVGGSPIA